MARAAVKSRSATGHKAADVTVPKRRPGRPPGVKNKVKTAPVKAARSGKAAATKSAPPKRNKAELETHVIKLERTVLRLREQNKELKRAAAAPAETAEEAAPAAPKPVRRRAKKEAELPVE